MPTFILTALHDVTRPNLSINRGDQFTIHINMSGILSGNLFNNSRCKDALIQQFRVNGIDVPYSDAGIYSRGTWDIDML